MRLLELLNIVFINLSALGRNSEAMAPLVLDFDDFKNVGGDGILVLFNNK